MIPTARQLLKDNFLLIENDKTCEAHTLLVERQMIEFAKLHVKAALEAADGEVPLYLSEQIKNCYSEQNIK